MKKTKLTIAYFLVALLGAIALYTWNDAKQLENQITANNAHMQKLNARLAMHEALLQGDSLVMQGDYSNALSTYSKSEEPSTESDGATIELRKAFAKAFIALESKEKSNTPSTLEEVDSTSIADAKEPPANIDEIDSLGFALKKMQAQVTHLQKQLRKKASGQYLTFTTSKGSVVHYVGEVKNKKANGMGVALLSTGSRYEGQWKNNQRHGEGTFYWPDGQSYEGTYMNDKRDGEGTYYWPNGEKYVGQWKGDERFGEGVFYGKKGDIVASGIWEDDELIAEPNRRRK